MRSVLKIKDCEAYFLRMHIVDKSVCIHRGLVVNF